jgi:peptidoglycan/xylan/chitin deacetylase (PgdA/CDA1 family)
LKRSVERILVLAGPAALARRLTPSATLVLAYHNIVPTGEQGGTEQPLHLPQREFARHLELLGRTHEVVPLDDLLRDAPRPSARPRVVLTFDDGYLGALSAGVTEVRRYGFPATFFVTPGRLGRHAFWWDRLGTPRDGGVPADVRDHALRVLRGQDEAVCAWAGPRALAVDQVPECARSATEAELAGALAIAGISVAAHSWSHPNLAALEATQLAVELERPLQWLRERWPGTLPAVSYPYGLVSPEVAPAARRAGYQVGFLVAGGRLPTQWQHQTSLLPRLNIPAGVSPDGFVLRTSGVLRR